jgi:hypothetical protein
MKYQVGKFKVEIDATSKRVIITDTLPLTEEELAGFEEHEKPTSRLTFVEITLNARDPEPDVVTINSYELKEKGPNRGPFL